MEVIKGRGYAYSIQYHIVWCTKYNQKILIGQIKNRLIEILEHISVDNKFSILNIHIEPYYIYMFINCSPQHYIPNIMKGIKGVSARLLMKEFRDNLRKDLSDKHLWNSSYFVATTSENTKKQIKQYIQNQNKNIRRQS